ncbi:MAG: hypothetical protein IJK18_05230 [Clostridia bacterium]|nr:hypothetical protein [Clostridia bacterium]
MEEKEPIKVKLSIVLLINAIIIVITITIGFIYKQNIEKNATNKNITNNTTVESTAQKDEEIQQLAVNEQKDIDKIILDELKEKRILAKNNIDIDSKVKYAKMNSNGNPIYIVHVEYEQDEDGNCSTYFFVSYNNGQVLFSKALEHKYEYDLYYEQNTMTIKAELAYKEKIRTIFGKIEAGEFIQLDEFIEPANEENLKYILNDKEVSKKEYETRKTQYTNKQFTSFSETAQELVSENETVQNITGQGNTNSEDEKEEREKETKQNTEKLIQFDEIFYELKDAALEYRECEKIKNYKDFEYDLDGDSKKDKITIKNIGKDDLRKRRRYL